MSFSDNVTIYNDISPIDNSIGPGQAGLPKSPPNGYKPITGKVPAGIGAIAKKLLKNSYGTMTPFELNGIKYMARIEPHYHPLDYKSGPTGWHKGVTVYIESNINPNVTSQNIKPITAPEKQQTITQQPQNHSSKIEEILKKIDHFLNNF
jgi:hypothetical protein